MCVKFVWEWRVVNDKEGNTSDLLRGCPVIFLIWLNISRINLSGCPSTDQNLIPDLPSTEQDCYVLHCYLFNSGVMWVFIDRKLSSLAARSIDFIMFIGPCFIVMFENKRQTWCHLLFYFTSYAFNMFRTLIYPSSGYCDYSVELPHWSYCSWFDVCWSFGVVGLEWYPPTHIEPRTHDQCGNSTE